MIIGADKMYRTNEYLGSFLANTNVLLAANVFNGAFHF